MVVTLNTHIALIAMGSSRWSIDIAIIAKFKP